MAAMELSLAIRLSCLVWDLLVELTPCDHLIFQLRLLRVHLFTHCANLSPYLLLLVFALVTPLPVLKDRLRLNHSIYNLR